MKKNLPLIIGIILPIFFIVIISIIIFVPNFSVKPQHNFVYTVRSNDNSYNYPYLNAYRLEGDQIVLSSTTPKYEGRNIVTEIPSLYLYDVKTDTYRKISYDEAKQLSFETEAVSSDGYKIEYRYGGNDGIFELFGSNRDNNVRGYYVFKDNGRKKLKLNDSTANLYWDNWNFKFIGWVK